MVDQWWWVNSGAAATAIPASGAKVCRIALSDRLAVAIDATAQAVARIEKPFANSIWKP